jgi:hypothetical protein
MIHWSFSCFQLTVKACQWLATGPGTPVSSTNKIDHHDITEVLLNVASNTITLSNGYITNHLVCCLIFVLFFILINLAMILTNYTDIIHLHQ